MNWNTQLFLLITLIVVIYMIWQLLIIILFKIKKQIKIIDTYEQYLEAKTSFNKSEEVLLSQIKAIFGDDVSQHIKAGTIWENMPTYLLEVALGEPKKIEKTEHFYIWLYGPYKDLLQEEYYLKINVDKKAVKTWKKCDLEKTNLEEKETYQLNTAL